MTSARQQKRKFWIFLASMNIHFHNSWTNSICEKSRNQLRSTCIPGAYKPATLKPVGKSEISFHHNSSPTTLGTTPYDWEEIPCSYLLYREGRKGLDYTSNILIFLGPPDGLVSILPKSEC